MVTMNCPWCEERLAIDVHAAFIRCDACSMVHEIADADQVADPVAHPVAHAVSAASRPPEAALVAAA
jgi:hypothetical protein